MISRRMLDRRDKIAGCGQATVDMTSMVDVTFLLLLFFMVTAAFQLHKAIALPEAQFDVTGTKANRFSEEIVSVHVDDRGSFFVMTPDWQLDTPGKQNLVTALKKAVSESSQTPRLSVQIHELAKLASLVDVLDAGSIAGCATIRVTQVEHLSSI